MPALETPLLFLIFNRTEETARVFEAIRAQRPKYLFVAADGPRAGRPNEAEVVRQTREVATKVDWPCEVQTLFRNENLGCGRAVSGAISWFFDQVEEGIILEDDCLPHPDFFPFCTELLARYRDEPRIATIAGTYFFPPQLAYDGSYYVSKYFQMWGWASWRRSWKHYDFTLETQTEAEWSALFQRVHPNPSEAGYWREIYQSLRGGAMDTWDFQVFFSCWRAGANHLMPGRNLVSNIGYGPSATHTNFASPMANLPTFPLKVGTAPASLDPDGEMDNLVFYLRFLESMHHTGWIEQALKPELKLGQTRLQLAQSERRIKELEREVADKRRQLLAATRTLALQANVASG